MQKLANRKIENANKINKLNSEIGAQTNTLSAKKASFETTYNRFCKEIQDNVSKIETYITD